ncbi:MAG: hypothetical protein EOP50_14215 [Sphingobacteriales bacterium]|nr:MAG: hypothetical protein EOP50_14215 [Sphingobacteriales bacterium]
MNLFDFRVSAWTSDGMWERAGKATERVLAKVKSVGATAIVAAASVAAFSTSSTAAATHWPLSAHDNIVVGAAVDTAEARQEVKSLTDRIHHLRSRIRTGHAGALDQETAALAADTASVIASRPAPGPDWAETLLSTLDPKQ